MEDSESEWTDDDKSEEIPFASGDKNLVRVDTEEEDGEESSDDSFIVDDVYSDEDGDYSGSNDDESTAPRSPRSKKARVCQTSLRLSASQNSAEEAEIPPNHMVCEVCKEAGRNDYILSRDMFSSAVKRGEYGKRFGKPHCLRHSAGFQENYINFLERKKAAQLRNAPGPPDQADDGSCFHCQEQGHWVRDCPMARCTTCRETGHWASRCPQGSGASSSPSPLSNRQQKGLAHGSSHSSFAERAKKNNVILGHGAYHPSFIPPPEEPKIEQVGTHANPVRLDEDDEELPAQRHVEWIRPAKTTTANTSTTPTREPHTVKIKGIKMNSITTYFRPVSRSKDEC